MVVFMWGMVIGALLCAIIGSTNSGKEYNEVNYQLHLKGQGMFITLIFVLSVIFSIMKLFGVS